MPGFIDPITGKHVRTDRSLLNALAAGDKRALEALFERFHLVVRCFLARMEGVDDRDLDDLVQATFLELTRAAEGFRGHSEVSTWIFGIAVNVVRHHVRRERRRRAHLSALAKLPSRAPDRPDVVAENRRYLERLEQAIAELPQRLQMAYVLCVVYQIPGRVAARELKIPEGTLSRRVREARQALAAEIGWRDEEIDRMAKSLKDSPAGE
jgi:RNA polymerase sigma factor (sigma-70 family)